MPIDEIVVRGKRIRIDAGGSPGDFSRRPGFDGPARERGGRERQPPPVQSDGDGSGKAFLPPPLVQPIEEIIVKAQRPSRLGWRSIAGGLLRGAGWIISGGAAIYELDRYRRRLESEQDEKAKKEAEERRLQRLAQETLRLKQPETIPEIIVRGKRPQAFQPYVLPPLPTWRDRYTDPDPWIMEPFYPRILPDAPTTPRPVITPPEVPTAPPVTIPAPTRTPTRRTAPPRIEPGILPGTTPRIRPETRPGTRPATRPDIQPRPATQPQPATNPLVQPTPQVNPQVNPLVNPSVNLRTRQLTRSRPSVRPSNRAQPFPLPGLANANCPPCPRKKCEEEEDKPRSECWRKLVKEGRFPSDDTEYPWVPIDCDTGREIKGPRMWR